MVRFAFISLVGILLLGACSSTPTTQPAVEDQEELLVTVYREPT